MPAPDRRLARFEQSRINFVFAQIQLGLTMCHVARQREGGVDRCLANARRAYKNATKQMLKLRLTNEEFHQITANVERLKFEIESVEVEKNHEKHPPPHS